MMKIRLENNTSRKLDLISSELTIGEWYSKKKVDRTIIK
jgi:hypothetical protein